MQKIYCEEEQKEEFDKLPMEEIRNMIGYYEPVEGDWVVTMRNGAKFNAKSQSEAVIISNLEQVTSFMIKIMGFLNQATDLNTETK